MKESVYAISGRTKTYRTLNAANRAAKALSRSTHSTLEVVVLKERVTGRTRAPEEGKLVRCPHCGFVEAVYHFSWSGLGCMGCKREVNKDEYIVAEYVSRVSSNRVSPPLPVEEHGTETTEDEAEITRVAETEDEAEITRVADMVLRMCRAVGLSREETALVAAAVLCAAVPDSGTTYKVLDYVNAQAELAEKAQA